MTQDFDVLITGAGPAGLSAAIELANAGWQVLVIDKEPLPRFKVCGGFIGPELEPVLRRYRIYDELLMRGAKHVSHFCLSSSGGSLARIPVAVKGGGKHALAVSRKVLDQVLLERAVSLGVQVWDSSKVQRSEAADGLQRVCIESSQTRSLSFIRTRHRIQATGLIRPSGGGSSGAGFGVSAIFRHVKEMNEDVFLHLIKGGHFGINRFEGDWVNACYVADAARVKSVRGDLNRLFEIFMNENPFIARQLGGAERISEWKGIHIPKPSKPVFFRDGAFCTGDAVAAVNPIVGGGITMAIEGGALLAKSLAAFYPSAVNQNVVLKAYAQNWKKIFYRDLTLSRLWGRLGHSPAVANPVLALFASKKEILNKIFELQHHAFKPQPALS